MRVLQIHNYYRFRGGEDNMFEHVCGMLRDHGHDVLTFERRSDSIEGAVGKVRASLSGIYSPASKAAVVELIHRERPQLAHVHNLYPLISPSAMAACRSAGIPVVMRCPNYRLVCPTGIHLREGKPCDLCNGGREYWCAITNCRGNWVESAAMAARSAIVRWSRLILDTVAMFVPPSECVKQRLMAAGIPLERIRVVPNTVPLPDAAADASRGTYIGLAARLSEEKGVNTLIEAARLLPGIPFKIAGEGPLLEPLRKSAPANVEFLGQIGKQELAQFYARSRVCVVPSVWMEAFGLVAAEAMAHGIPVIATRMGALPEIVDDARTGYLFNPGDAGALARHIETLWESPGQCRAMGMEGREKVRREYVREVYYARIMGVYEHVLNGGKPTRVPAPAAARIA
ncbi:MAG: glycosyl transferase [Candidatus Hydrogenedentota bacterium]